MQQLNKNTKAYKNKLDYISSYKKEHTKGVYITLYINNKENQELYNFLEEMGRLGSKNLYLKSLIKADMNKRAQ